MNLAPGTPCFLVGLVDYPALSGRVCEVIGLVPTPADETGTWYAVHADWMRDLFPGRVEARRDRLKPIVPPEDHVPADVSEASLST